MDEGQYCTFCFKFPQIMTYLHGNQEFTLCIVIGSCYPMWTNVIYIFIFKTIPFWDFKANFF